MQFKAEIDAAINDVVERHHTEKLLVFIKSHIDELDSDLKEKAYAALNSEFLQTSLDLELDKYKPEVRLSVMNELLDILNTMYALVKVRA